MGFGEIAASTIMFITVLSAATLVALTFNNYASSANSAITARQQFMASQLRTDITIEHIVYDSLEEQIRLYVRNTGDTSLRLDQISAYIADKRIEFGSSDASISIAPDTDLINPGIWDPSEIAVIQVNQSVSSSIHKAIVMTPYGVSAQKDFSV